jgi:hypothetical protein
MQALKVLVVLMAVAIVAILAVIVVAVIQRAGSDAPAAGGRSAGFGALDLALPEGCGIARAELRDERLVLRLDGPAGAGCQKVVVFDMESGRELGSVTGRPAP